MNTMTNGQARKSLAQQIDRLDNVLDGLADNLQEAVAEAVQQAVGQVLREVLGQPELLGRLRAANPWADLACGSFQQREPKPGLGQRLKYAASWIGRKLGSLSGTCGSALCGIAAKGLARVESLGHAAKRQIEQVREAAVARLHRGYRFLILCGHLARHARHLGLPLAFALAVGGVAAVTAWHCGPATASVVSGLGGFTTTLAVQASLWLRRSTGGWPFPLEVA